MKIWLYEHDADQKTTAREYKVKKIRYEKTFKRLFVYQTNSSIPFIYDNTNHQIDYFISLKKWNKKQRDKWMKTKLS